MPERIINGVKIRLLVRSYSEWSDPVNSSYIPGKGEVCIVTVPASTQAVASEPAVLFKVGDGTSTFAQLGYSSALAADVYNWAKQENLRWQDLNQAFLNELQTYVRSNGGQYKLVAIDNNRWKLQKSTDGGTTWADVSDSVTIDVSGKVPREISGSSGRALISNESDGGGAKFEHSDGTNSFVGVNDAGEHNLAAQIYAINKNTTKGSRINVSTDRICYISKTRNDAGVANLSLDPNYEIATMADIQSISGAMHFQGVVPHVDGNTPEQDIAAFYETLGKVPGPGDVVVFQGGAEYIYANSVWEEFGNQSAYATKQELTAEVAALDNAKVDKLAEGEVLILDCNPAS